MTDKELFEKVKNHLLTQNAKSMYIPNSEIGTQACAYRGKEGKKCAAGCLILDKFYTPELEGLGASHSLVTEALIQSRILPNQIVLVDRLENIHDYSEPEDWEEKLTLLEENYFPSDCYSL